MPTPAADPPESVTVPIRRRADGSLALLDEPTPQQPAAAPTPRRKAALPQPQPQPASLPAAEPPTPVPVPPPEVEAIPCPRCRAPLINPDSLALCPNCGWCRLLQEAAGLAGQPARPAERRSVLGSTEFVMLLWRLPGWIWGLIGSLAAAAALAATANHLLPAHGLPRALWTSGQIGVGLGLLLTAQAWALVFLAPFDDRLGTRDLFLPGRLWNLTLKQLPATKGPVLLATCGLALATAATWVGGLAYWLPVEK